MVVTKQELERCDRELAAIEATIPHPKSDPWGHSIGEADWHAERRLIELEYADNP